VYSHPRLLIAMAWSWIWGFVWFVLFFVVGVTSAFAFHTAVPATIAFLLFFPAGLFVTAGRWFLRCPQCQHVILVGRRPEHPAATLAYHGRGLAGIILDIAMKRQFTCLECGYHCTLFDTKGSNQSLEPTAGRRDAHT
jgi:hypothetical protein